MAYARARQRTVDRRRRAATASSWPTPCSAGTRPTVVLVPTWSIVPSRFWKAQVGYLARHYRVVTFDGRGSGGRAGPEGADAYTDREYAEDILAVMDADGVDAAVLVAQSCGASWAVHVAAGHPERVLGMMAIAPSCGSWQRPAGRDHVPWDEPLDDTQGWAKYNRHYWLGRRLRRLHRVLLPADVLRAALDQADRGLRRLGARDLAADPGRTPPPGGSGATARVRARAAGDAVTCPVVVVHGTDDRIRPLAFGERLAELTGGELVQLEHAGHGPSARDPVKVNHLIAQFVDRFSRARQPADAPTWSRAARGHRGAVPLVAHRPRATRGGTSRSPRAAPAAPGAADRLARAEPGHPGARAARRAGPPGVGVAARRVGPHRARGRRARPARVPGDPPDGRDPGAQLHGLRRGGGRAATTW